MLKPLLDMYGCATLAEVLKEQVKETLRSVVCRCVEEDWPVDLGSKPRICILNCVCERV